MNKIIKIITLVFFLVFSANLASSKENFFDEALKMYQDKKYDDARFLLERNIVFNPKDAKSYLYLAKIYNHEENQRKEEYNLDTALLIEPNNEEVILMLMKVALKNQIIQKLKIFLKHLSKFVKNYVMKMMKFKSLLKI
jgi:tetratricopeptide (TPR) repeat protein